MTNYGVYHREGVSQPQANRAANLLLNTSHDDTQHDASFSHVDTFVVLFAKQSLIVPIHVLIVLLQTVD